MIHLVRESPQSQKLNTNAIVRQTHAKVKWVAECSCPRPKCLVKAKFSPKTVIMRVKGLTCKCKEKSGIVVAEMARPKPKAKDGGRPVKFPNVREKLDMEENSPLEKFWENLTVKFAKEKSNKLLGKFCDPTAKSPPNCKNWSKIEVGS